MERELSERNDGVGGGPQLGLARHRELKTLLGQIEGTPSPNRLWSLVWSFGVRLGFDQFLAVEATVLDGRTAYTVTHATPRRYALFLAEAFASADQADVERLWRTAAPCRLVGVVQGDSAARPHWLQALMLALKDDPLVVPMHDAAGKPLAAFIFGGKALGDLELAGAELHHVAYTAFDRIEASRQVKSQRLDRALSNREVTCLRMASQGRSDGEIADQLNLSPRTVRFHIDAAKVKLGATNRVTAIAIAMRDKLIAVAASAMMLAAHPGMQVW